MNIGPWLAGVLAVAVAPADMSPTPTPPAQTHTVEQSAPATPTGGRLVLLPAPDAVADDETSPTPTEEEEIGIARRAAERREALQRDSLKLALLWLLIERR